MHSFFMPKGTHIIIRTHKLLPCKPVRVSMVSIVVCTNKDGMQHWKELEGDIDIHTYTFTGHGISFNSCVHKQGRCVTLLAITGRGRRHTHTGHGISNDPKMVNICCWL